eukprot:TRINITY_DN714_c1_g1_i1.p1 TRINITY_DN714_c1_g1~~TRINITY_DN714_c1_g1_i1.p1  ORF type:complete len:310 (-),score=68.95 TRINITY_DN714_c1_g1_i1:26-955(-)
MLQQIEKNLNLDVQKLNESYSHHQSLCNQDLQQLTEEIESQAKQITELKEAMSFNENKLATDTVTIDNLERQLQETGESLDKLQQMRDQEVQGNEARIKEINDILSVLHNARYTIQNTMNKQPNFLQLATSFEELIQVNSPRGSGKGNTSGRFIGLLSVLAEVAKMASNNSNKGLTQNLLEMVLSLISEMEKSKALETSVEQDRDVSFKGVKEEMQNTHKKLQQDLNSIQNQRGELRQSISYHQHRISELEWGIQTKNNLHRKRDTECGKELALLQNEVDQKYRDVDIVTESLKLITENFEEFTKMFKN